MFVKYAKSKIAAVGSLKDVIPAEHLERGMEKVASLLPVANVVDDYIYIRSWAVSAGEVYGANDNHDYFERAELKKSYSSFVNTGFFKDHANHDIKLAYGLNLDAVYTNKDFVAVISAVKKSGLQPDQEDIANRIKNGSLAEVSMGCQVEQSICSHCGNMATNLGEYCNCLRFARGQRVAMVNGYCEECGTTPSFCEHIEGANKLGISFNKSANNSEINGSLLYEINRGCTFFDLSAITTVAADRRARIAEVFDKQASYELLNYIKPLPEAVKDLGGDTMGDQLEKVAKDKKEDGAAHPNQPVKPVDAGDYDHKGNDSGRPENGLNDSAKSETADKSHEILDRGRVDMPDYGPAGEDAGVKKPQTHNMHNKDTGAVSKSEVENYRAKGPKGQKQASSDGEFIGALKDFFNGMINKREASKTHTPANIDYKLLDEVRASLRDDLESLQEANDALHTEKLKLMAKASSAVLGVIKKRAQAEVNNFAGVEEEIKVARKMVRTAYEELEEKLEEEASGTFDFNFDKKDDDSDSEDKDSDSEDKDDSEDKGKSDKPAGDGKGLKSEVAEIRAEVDALLDKIVEMVSGKKKEEGKDGMPDFMKKGPEAPMSSGPEMASPEPMGAPDMSYKKDFGLGVMDRKLVIAAHKCENEDCKCAGGEGCGDNCKCASLRTKARREIMAYRAAQKRAAYKKKAASDAPKHPDQPEDSVPKDAGDYDHKDSKWNNEGGAGSAYNSKTDKETRGQIQREKKDMLGKQQENKKEGAKKPKEWLALKRMAVLTKQYVSEGLPLKEAKSKALTELERIASQYKKAINKKADGQLKENLINQVASEVADRIFDSNPDNPANQQAASEVYEAPTMEDGMGEGSEMFSPDVKPKAVASLQTKAYAEKDNSDKAPSDPYWDLFPEDNITSTVGEANSEMTSRSKETMREVKASVAGIQAPFSNNAAVRKQAYEDGESLMGSDSLTKVLESIGLAEKEVKAGLIEEGDMEAEAKRLFVTSPDELKATANMVEKVAKRNFKSPVPDGYMKQAISMGEGGGETKEESLFDSGDGIF